MLELVQYHVGFSRASSLEVNTASRVDPKFQGKQSRGTILCSRDGPSQLRIAIGGHNMLPLFSRPKPNQSLARRDDVKNRNVDEHCTQEDIADDCTAPVRTTTIVY